MAGKNGFGQIKRSSEEDKNASNLKSVETI
jgi:hypothetical protein